MNGESAGGEPRFAFFILHPLLSSLYALVRGDTWIVNRETSIVNTLRYKHIRIDQGTTLLDSNMLIIECCIHD